MSYNEAAHVTCGIVVEHVIDNSIQVLGGSFLLHQIVQNKFAAMLSSVLGTDSSSTRQPIAQYSPTKFYVP